MCKKHNSNLLTDRYEYNSSGLQHSLKVVVPRWGAALALVRARNAERILERGELPEDDVTSLLHVYCKGLAQAHPGMQRDPRLRESGSIGDLPRLVMLALQCSALEGEITRITRLLYIFRSPFMSEDESCRLVN